VSLVCRPGVAVGIVHVPVVALAEVVATESSGKNCLSSMTTSSEKKATAGSRTPHTELAQPAQLSIAGSVGAG
jgi:hypothetical protein